MYGKTVLCDWVRWRWKIRISLIRILWSLRIERRTKLPSLSDASKHTTFGFSCCTDTKTETKCLLKKNHYALSSSHSIFCTYVLHVWVCGEAMRFACSYELGLLYARVQTRWSHGNELSIPGARKRNREYYPIRIHRPISSFDLFCFESSMKTKLKKHTMHIIYIEKKTSSSFLFGLIDSITIVLLGFIRINGTDQKLSVELITWEQNLSN